MGNQLKKILLIEDNPGDARLLREMLTDIRHEDKTLDAALSLEWVDCLSAGLQRLAQESYHVVLLDLRLPESQGLDTFNKVHAAAPEAPILVTTNLDNETLAVQAVQKGAQDYLVKGQLDSNLLARAIHYAVKRQELVRDSKQHMRELQDSEARFRKIIEENADGIIIVDESGTVRFVNQAAEALFDRSRDEIIGELFGFPVVVSEATELDIVRPNRESAVAEMRVVQTEWKGEIAYIASLRDITDRKRLEAELERARQLEHHLAYHDSLTGLPNRQLFYDRMRHALAEAKRYGQQIGLLFIDLDDFKDINDTLGHSVGDRLLQAVTQRLQHCVRESDTIARLGGDEFVVILNRLALASGPAKVAQKILKEVSRPFVVAGHELFTTASIGISVYPSDGADIETLIKNADIAMYHAKGQCKNTYRLYNLSMYAIDTQRRSMQNHLRKALEKCELSLYYQPQISLSTGEMTGVEALLRWHHPEFGQIPPEEFIPLAEETGLIVPIGEWALRTACKQNKAWQEAGFPLMRVAVNLSARQFRKKTLPKIVAQVLAETGLRPDDLDLEITESNAMEDVDYTIETLQILKELGCQLSVDDFGRGYSSLSYLKHFPIDRLKIDKSFVRGIPADLDDVSITTAIVALTRRPGLRAIAEGVETEAQSAFLHSLRCDEAQGFLFSRPLSVEELTKRLQEESKNRKRK